MNNSDRDFKDYLRDNVNRYESQQPTPEPDWNDLQRRMNAGGKGSGFKTARYISLGAAAAVAAGALFYFASNDVQDNQATQYSQRTEQPVKKLQVDEDAGNSKDVSAEHKNEQAAAGAVEKQDATTENRTENRATPNTHADSRPATSLGTSADDSGSDQVYNEEKNPETEDTKAGVNSAAKVELNIQVSPVKRTFCVGEPLEYTTNKPVDDLNLKQQTSLGLDIDYRGNYLFAEPGNGKFKVEYFVDGRKGTDEFEVTVVARPEARIESQMSLVDGGRPQYKFTAENTNHSAMRRWVNGNERSKTGDLVEDFTKKGNYEVVQVAYSAAGCTDTAFKTVSVNNDYNLLAPDAFTPNGDGLNDTWLPLALKEPVYDFTLEIRDIKGNLVFQTSDPNVEWSGPEGAKHQNAPAQNTFIWKAVVQYKGKTEHYGGAVRVIY